MNVRPRAAGEGVREEGFTSVEGVRVHFEAWGSGAPVVLVHGLGASAASWRAVGPRLADAGFRALALDLKGCGRSARPRGDYSREALAALVAGFMENVGVRRARAVVGHSMGGAIVLELATRRPELVERVVVVDGQGIVTTDPLLQLAAPAAPLLGEVASRMTAFAPLAPRRFFARAYLRRIFGDPSRVTAELVQRYAESADAGAHRAMFAMIERLGDTAALAAACRGLRMPALLVWGDADPVCPPALGEELRRHLPDAELRLLPGCGHCPPEERPEELTGHLLEFLSRPGPPRAQNDDVVP